MHVTLRHEHLGAHNITTYFRTEIDLDSLYDHMDFKEAVEEWQDDVREQLGYDEDDEDQEKPDIDYVIEDSEDIPEHLLDTDGPSDTAWGYIAAMADDGNRSQPEIYWAAEALSIAPENVQEAYQGQFSSDEEFAQHLAEELDLMPEGMEWPFTHIDWVGAARDLMMGYAEEDGHYFRSL